MPRHLQLLSGSSKHLINLLCKPTREQKVNNIKVSLFLLAPQTQSENLANVNQRISAKIGLVINPYHRINSWASLQHLCFTPCYLCSSRIPYAVTVKVLSLVPCLKMQRLQSCIPTCIDPTEDKAQDKHKFFKRSQ